MGSRSRWGAWLGAGKTTWQGDHAWHKYGSASGGQAGSQDHGGIVRLATSVKSIVNMVLLLGHFSPLFKIGGFRHMRTGLARVIEDD